MCVHVFLSNQKIAVGDLRKDVTAGQYVIPGYLSIGLRNTIKKCMSIDKYKRTRVHLALKDDPWLTDNGTLADIFSYSTNSTTTVTSSTMLSKDDELARLKKEKERLKFQHMRDMEEEKRSKKYIKRTIICHPKNPSIYFTSAVPHSAKPEDKYTNSETQRHLLFQKINEISHQIQLSSTQNAGKSPIRHLLRKLKQPESLNSNINSLPSNGSNTSTVSSSSASSAGTTLVPPRTIVRKSASNMSLTQLYQRVAKDQVHYYTFHLTPQVAMQLSGIADSSLSLQQQDEFTMMLIIRGICDIMGITYHRDKNDHLICVMALSDYINEKPRSFYKLKRRDSKMAASNQSLSVQQQQHSSHDGGNTGSQASFSRSSAGDMNRSSYFGSSSKFSKFKKMTSHVLSSIFPYHSSTLVVQDSRSVRYPPFPTLNPNRTGSSQSSQNSQTHQENSENNQDQGQDKKPGVAIFAIEIISLSKEATTQNRITAIKLVKIEGSSKVFRIACGWLTGVIGQNITPAQLSDNFNNLTATIHGSSTDIPNMILQQQSKRLTRPKSVATLLPLSTMDNTFPSQLPLDSPPPSTGQFEKPV